MAGPSKPIPGQTAVVNPRGAAYLDNLNSEEEMGHRMGTPPLRMKGNKDEIRRPVDSPAHTFRDIDDSGSEPDVYDKPLSSSGESEVPASIVESEVDQDDFLHRTAKPQRRAPQPSGRLFDPPCERCSFKGIPCLKEIKSSACIPCYKAKHGCIYGQRRGRKDKGKGKAKEVKKRARTESEDEEQSSSNLGRGKAASKKQRVEPAAASGSRRPPKKSAKYIVDSDVETDNDTGLPPVATLPPSPLRQRAAALKAKAAVAAVIEMERDPHRVPKKGELKCLYVILCLRCHRIPAGRESTGTTKKK